MKLDLNFNQKYVYRYLLMNKISNYSNTYETTIIDKIIFSFSLAKIEDLDRIDIYNYMYLFKFFLGKKAFLSKIKKLFSLGCWYYSFKIQIIIYNGMKGLIDLQILRNDIWTLLNETKISINNFNYFKNICQITLKNYNIFSGLKTNLGLFNIKSFLIINIFFIGGDWISQKKLLGIIWK